MVFNPKVPTNFPEQDFLVCFYSLKSYGVMQQQTHAICSCLVTQCFFLGKTAKTFWKLSGKNSNSAESNKNDCNKSRNYYSKF